MAAGHEKAVAFGAAKAQVGAALRQPDVADGLAGGVEHHHPIQLFGFGVGRAIAAPAAPQVAVLVALDAVDGTGPLRGDDDPLARQCAVRPNVVGPDHAVGLVARLHPVQQLFVRREAQPVGAGQVFQRARHAAVGRINPVHAMGQLGLGLVALPVAADAKRRVREPDGAVALADDVVRRIQALAVVAVSQHGDGAVVFGARDAARQVFAGQQTALAIARQAVAEVGRMSKDADSARGFVPSQDAVIGNVGHQQIAPVAHPHRPFQPAKAAGQLFHAAAVDAVLGKLRVQNANGRIRVALLSREIE
ncbi:hypothetical protein G6F57_016843 [Rhizopus arrhizus]|nr:hypothetical protein G6F57_016843 [Rhizopus arrhizus]